MRISSDTPRILNHNYRYIMWPESWHINLYNILKILNTEKESYIKDIIKEFAKKGISVQQSYAGQLSMYRLILTPQAGN